MKIFQRYFERLPLKEGQQAGVVRLVSRVSQPGRQTDGVAARRAVVVHEGAGQAAGERDDPVEQSPGER